MSLVRGCPTRRLKIRGCRRQGRFQANPWLVLDFVPSHFQQGTKYNPDPGKARYLIPGPNSARDIVQASPGNTFHIQVSARNSVPCFPGRDCAWYFIGLQPLHHSVSPDSPIPMNFVRPRLLKACVCSVLLPVSGLAMFPLGSSALREDHLGRTGPVLIQRAGAFVDV